MARGSEMEAWFRLIKLRPGSSTLVEEWAQTVNGRKDEALATLKSEGVELESWFSVTLDGDEYLAVYMRAASIEAAFKAAENSDHEIDSIHRKVMDQIIEPGEGAVGNLLIDLSHVTSYIQV
jgi:hypothetical protein